MEQRRGAAAPLLPHAQALAGACGVRHVALDGEAAVRSPHALLLSSLSLPTAPFRRLRCHKLYCVFSSRDGLRLLRRGAANKLRGSSDGG